MEQTEFLLASDRLQKKIKHSNGFLSPNINIAPTHNADSLNQRPLVSISIIFHMVYWPLMENIREKINLCVTSVRNFFKTNQSRDAGN